MLATYSLLSVLWIPPPFHCSRKEDRIAETGARSSNSDLSLTVCALQHAKPRDKVWQEALALPLEGYIIVRETDMSIIITMFCDMT